MLGNSEKEPSYFTWFRIATILSMCDLPHMIISEASLSGIEIIIQRCQSQHPSNLPCLCSAQVSVHVSQICRVKLRQRSSRKAPRRSGGCGTRTVIRPSLILFWQLVTFSTSFFSPLTPETLAETRIIVLCALSLYTLLSYQRVALVT